MNFENRIFALERSLDRQRKITTALLCLLFAVLGMGATSVVKETVEVTNGGFGRPESGVGQRDLFGRSLTTKVE